MSLPTPTLRIDTSGTALGDVPTWTDYTSSLLLAGDGKPIVVIWGRQDEQSEPQTRTCSFLLSNTTGQWTPGNAAAPSGWRRGARVNVRLTVSATVYDRFDGYVESILPTWPGGVQSWAVVEVTCTDITARLKKAQPLRAMVEQEMLQDGASYLYPLSEGEGATSAGEVAGTGRPAAARIDSKYGATAATFGTEMTGMAEPLTGVNFGTAWSPNGFKLSVLSVASNSTTGPFVPTTGAHSVEAWVIGPASVSPGADQARILYQGDTGQLNYADLSVNSTDGSIGYFLASGAATVAAFNGQNVCDGRLHHIVATLSADRTTVKVYVDGVLSTSGTGSALPAFADFRYNTIGGLLTASAVGSQFPGTIADVAMYPVELTAAQVLRHYQAGVGTLLERSDVRYSRIASYGNISTSSLPTGQATIQGQQTAGRTVFDVLAEVARTEGTVSYVTGTGALTFQARNTRYTPASTLAITNDDIDGDVTFRHDGQGFANEFTINRSGGASQRIVDSTSQALYGRADGGTVDVASSSDFDAAQLGDWLVALHKDPFTARVPNVTVDLLSQPTSGTVQNVLAADISTQLTISGLPSQAPASSVTLFIEGGSESIGPEEWSVTFNTSPALPFQTLRVDAVASSRTKLDAGLKIPF